MGLNHFIKIKIDMEMCILFGIDLKGIKIDVEMCILFGINLKGMSTNWDSPRISHLSTKIECSAYKISFEV